MRAEDGYGAKLVGQLKTVQVQSRRGFERTRVGKGASIIALPWGPAELRPPTPVLRSELVPALRRIFDQ